MNEKQIIVKIIIAQILIALVSCNKQPLLNNVDKSRTKVISGFVQKGPFIKGSSVTIQVLDEHLNPIGKTYNTQILNSVGEFCIVTNTEDTLFEFIASGYYFNELKNSLSNNELTLRAIVKVIEDTTININTLTYMITERMRYLIDHESYTFEDAKKKAERELLENFNIPVDSIDFPDGFEKLDITKSNEGNAVLLAISCTLLGNRTTAEFIQIMANILSDIREDGLIDSSQILDEIREDGKLINFFKAKYNLKTYYDSLKIDAYIPDFEKYCDNDGDGILNYEDNDYDIFKNLTKTDKNGIIKSIDENDWGYNGEYEVGDTINLTLLSNFHSSEKCTVLPPFPNPINKKNTLNFYFNLPMQNYLKFYFINEKGDTMKLINSYMMMGSYHLPITIEQVGYYEAYFIFGNYTIKGTVLVN
ncbi:MAG: hypothetical protein H0Z29_03920 [Candidatus Marinimicrobia bacterium]|nr:hypothetical protein [Candidatus Neomarinimicrobiota bacterium]